MNQPGFITTLLVDQTPREVFNAVNNVRGWWSEEIDGHTAQLNEVFNYQYEDVHHCAIKVTELEPGKKVVWLVLNNYFKFTEDKTEWTNTKIIFEIFEKDGKTGLQFTHEGLVPVMNVSRSATMRGQIISRTVCVYWSVPVKGCRTARAIHKQKMKRNLRPHRIKPKHISL